MSATVDMIMPIVCPVTPPVGFDGSSVTHAMDSVPAVQNEGATAQLIPTMYPEKILVDKWLPTVVFPHFYYR